MMTCRRSRPRCAASSPPTSRCAAKSWDRADTDESRSGSRTRARASRPNGPPNCPRAEELSVYHSGRLVDMCRGPHLPSTGKLDPASLQADARIGRLLARRSRRTRMLQPHLWHRLAQQEAAGRAPDTGWRKPPSATIAGWARRWTCSTSRAEAHGSVFWHPKGYRRLARARSLYAPRHRRRGLQGGQDAADHGRPPVGGSRATGANTARTCSSSPTKCPMSMTKARSFQR